MAGSLDPDALLAGLDPEQREVATALSGPVAVIAGAGTGKTRAITHRIAYGVATGAYRPTSVLAVTFTTRAAGELRGRLQQLGAQGVQARTFHSAALRQAQYFWPRVYGAELPAVLDNRMSLIAEAAGRLRVSVDTPRLRDLVSEISWAKVSNVSPENYPRLAGQHHRRLASFDPETVGRVFTAYERLKQDRSRIDFEDILLCAAALLSENQEVAETVRQTYRHLVVDEYQDVSPLQEALLTLWRGDRTELCVVGDPAQTIHSFAGAQAGFLTGFARRFPQARVIRLVRDYRSTPQVVGLANLVTAEAAQRRGAGPVQLEAQQPAGPDVALVEAPDEAAEAAGVAAWLAQQAAEGVAYREMAVLFRINAQSPPMEQALANRGIPYLVRGGERFYERPEVRQALVMLRTEVKTSEQHAGENGVERFRALLEALGWTEQPPEGGGAMRERWESLAALLGAAEDLQADARAGGGGRPCGDLGRARSAGRGPARPGGPGRDGRYPALGEGPGVGRSRAPGSPRGLVALRAGHLVRAGGGGASAALCRDHPRPAAAACVVVPDPQRWREYAQGIPIPGGRASRDVRGGYAVHHRSARPGPRLAAVGPLPVVRPAALRCGGAQDRPPSELSGDL